MSTKDFQAMSYQELDQLNREITSVMRTKMQIESINLSTSFNAGDKVKITNSKAGEVFSVQKVGRSRAHIEKKGKIYAYPLAMLTKVVEEVKK